MKFKSLCLRVCSKVDVERRENAYFYFKDSSCLWSEHWKCADKNLYIYIYIHKTGDINYYYYND